MGTSGDVAAAAAANMGVTFARGSAVGDITRAHIKAGNPATPTYDAAAAVSVLAVVTTSGSETTTITTVGANVASIANDDKFYFHTYGPFVMDSFTAGTDTDDLVFSGVAKQEAITQHFGTSITLSETFAGGQLRQVCAGCVTAQDGTSLKLSVNTMVNNVPLGALVGTSTSLNVDNFAMVTEEVREAATQEIKVGKSANREGTNFFINRAAVLSGATDDLYMIQGLSAAGYSYSTITEDAAGTTYQYVAQCSNRGACDASTGLCKCFKGYSNDNCDTQNMLAA